MNDFLSVMGGLDATGYLVSAYQTTGDYTPLLAACDELQDSGPGSYRDAACALQAALLQHLQGGSIMPMQVGKTYLIQEARGLFIGEVVEASPFEVSFSESAVWVRNLGPMRTAIETGAVVECHSTPCVTLQTAALRFWMPWPHKVPA